MKITRLKHAAFLVETGGRRVAVDVGDYVSPQTLTAVGKLDGVLISHQHADHYHEPNVLAAGAPVAAPSDVVAILPPHLESHVLRLDETLSFQGFEVTPVLADHGPRLSRSIQNLGLAIEADGLRVYYVGDAARPPVPPAGRFDLLMVSTDGTGFVFSPEQAAAFVRDLGHAGQVMPIHDGDGDEPWHAQRFATLVADICKPVILEPGQSLEVGS